MQLGLRVPRAAPVIFSCLPVKLLMVAHGCRAGFVHMNKQVTIQKQLPGKAYPIYNRGNYRDKLFFDERNYYYFLRLWKRYIDPIADTFCYCLLPDHFHFYIRMKNSPGLYAVKGSIAIPAERYSSNLFNACCKAINKGYRRRGSLFRFAEDLTGLLKIQSFRIPVPIL